MNTHKNPQDYSILMVDDMPKNIQVLGSILRSCNYELEYATNGEMALECVSKFDYDLILLDVMMPGIDGFQVCKTIRENEKYNDVPIIFLTAKTDKESVVKGFEIGAQDYVTKPFDANELIARVNTQLELKYSKQKLKETNLWLEEKVAERTAELKKANEELKELDKAKSNFINVISHEIRTPLNGILGMSNLLSEMNTDKDSKRMFDLLNLSCKRLEDFSINTMDISRLQLCADKELVIEDINLKSIIENIIDENKKLLDDKKINFSTNIQEFVLKADINYIYKSLKILIENAIQHSNENGNISVSINVSGEECQIKIKDSGNGFPEKIIDNELKLFDNDDHIDGNPGIDLYLCDLIVNTHGGKMELLNDSGAVVNINIPL